MKKQKKQFIITCILLLAFIILFVILQSVQKQQEKKDAQKEQEETITPITVTMDAIKGFTYQYDGEDITFEKEEDVWYLESDHEIPISQSMISSMLTNIEQLTAAQQITNITDTAEYGFDPPLNVITLQIDEDTLTITIGMYNEITNQYYLMVSGSDNIYLVEESIYSAFEKSIADMKEK